MAEKYKQHAHTINKTQQRAPDTGSQNLLLKGKGRHYW